MMKLKPHLLENNAVLPRFPRFPIQQNLRRLDVLEFSRVWNFEVSNPLSFSTPIINWGMVILPVMMGILAMEQYIYMYIYCIYYIYVSAQILILHQPRFAWNKLNKGISWNLSYLLRAQVGSWGRNEIWPDICIVYVYKKSLQNQQN